MKKVEREYDIFLTEAAALASDYGDNNITEYLTLHRVRISSQIAIQLKIIERDDLGKGRMLSLGGWPGAALIILNRLSGISGTLLDHPALLTDTMAEFYKEHGLKTVAFDFAEAAHTPIPLTNQYNIIECCQCIEHWNFSPIPVFRQIISNLLSPKGNMLITVPNATSLYRRLAVLSGRNPYPSMQSFIDVDSEKAGAEVAPHWREYTQKDLELLITHCGGSSIESRTASYQPATYKSTSQRLYSLFNNLHPRFKENVEVVLKKT
ncbi:MAG: methyltransferase domain-containing protein [Pontiella sp.]